jgi:hypothetical protein
METPMTATVVTPYCFVAKRARAAARRVRTIADIARNRYSGNYTPAPGTEYPFSVSDIAHATARVLGDGWMAEAGYWGTTGYVCGPEGVTFVFRVDDDGDLCIEFEASYRDEAPKGPALPDGVRSYWGGVILESASAVDGLDHLAQRSAAAIRAVAARR